MEINNKFIKWLLIFVGIILTDFYFFPLTPTVLPYGNTKMIMAVMSIFLVLTTHHRNIDTSKALRLFITMCVFAILVSFCTYITIVVNNTHDYTYMSYIVSMLVWLGGAYTLVRYLRRVHSNLNLRIITFYLVAACALQCISAILISRYPGFENLINRLVVGQPEMLEFADGRLCGIGCAFDVAGIRFSAALVTAFFFWESVVIDKNIGLVPKTLYCLSLMIIAVIGNVISRTTTVGLVAGMTYVVWQLCFSSDYVARKEVRKWFSSMLLISIMVCIVLYNIDSQFRHDIRFGFEGFFSLFETGEWKVHSNDMLRGMYNVFPDNIKTWLFGDGLFIDTTNEPWYIGRTYGGYYKDVDVGYLRFIFYFGIIGLASFIAFLLYSMKVCIEQFPSCKVMFYGLMLIQLVIFGKVATDMFLIFALCIACGFVCDQFCIKQEDNNSVAYD